MAQQVENAQQVEVTVVGSSTFGRYPKISLEKTYNMFISDQWLVNYPGFKKVTEFNISEGNPGAGRAFFNSIRGGFVIAVVDSTVYRIDDNLIAIVVGTLNTQSGDVSIDENLNQQICIVDGQKAYIYNYNNGVFTTQNLQFIGASGTFNVHPNYVSYHNTFFLFGSSSASDGSQYWYAFEFNPADLNNLRQNSQFILQTKPDSALVVKRLPGRGNNILVLGSTVSEVWTQVGGLENYRRVQSFNIDYGIVSSSTIASSDEFLCWLSQNENNSPSILFTNGSSVERISSDGIDHLMDKILYPNESTAFFYRQDGHLFYQITFYDPADNLTLIYDFTTKKFFHGSDENLDFHPARSAVFFNELVYFISINDASIFVMDSELVTYDYVIQPDSVGEEIPRIRICNTIRKPDSDRFRAGQFTFWIEQGVNSYYAGNPIVPRVDMSFSKSGNESFSNIVSRPLNTAGNYRNQIRWWRLGQANEFTIQLRFWGFQRFLVNNGSLEIY